MILSRNNKHYYKDFPFFINHLEEKQKKNAK